LTQPTLTGEVLPPREFVYYATDGFNIKIGTTKAPARRGGELAVTFLLVFQGGVLDERRHQRMWAKYRIGTTEWFRPADELLLWLTTALEPSTRELAVLQAVIKHANSERRQRAA
jgi:hypothetical protein